MAVSRPDTDPAARGAVAVAGGSSAPRAEPFGDRIAARVAARRSQLVLGLDPDPARLWPRALEAVDRSPDRGAPGAPAALAARAVLVHCELVLEAVADQCVAVKPQVACFERLGGPGWVALGRVIERARSLGLLVIADAKRGDVDVTAAAYAQGFLGQTPTPFGPVAGLGADALTVNPLLGRDSLEPFVAAARAGGGGLFVLVRTSNPGARDIQELALSEGGEVSGRLAALVASLGCVGVSGLSDIGAVVGATAPERLRRLREAMPHAVFLLPGVGAQGGRVEDLTAAFTPGPAAAVVAASRGIVAAHERAGGDPGQAARHEASRLRELAWSVAGG